MNTKCKVLMVLFLLISSSVYSQQTNIGSLKGIKGLRVTVETLNPSIEADGLREYQIRTDVELKLRLAGIKVLTR